MQLHSTTPQLHRGSSLRVPRAASAALQHRKQLSPTRLRSSTPFQLAALPPPQQPPKVASQRHLTQQQHHHPGCRTVCCSSANAAAASSNDPTSPAAQWKVPIYILRWCVRCIFLAPAAVHDVFISLTTRPSGCRYAFNIVFNILNKSSLNAFPCPWFISAWQLRKFACCSHGLMSHQGNS